MNDETNSIRRQLAMARIASAAVAAIERLDAGADPTFALDFIRRAVEADKVAAFGEFAEVEKGRGEA